MVKWCLGLAAIVAWVAVPASAPGQMPPPAAAPGPEAPLPPMGGPAAAFPGLMPGPGMGGPPPNVISLPAGENSFGEDAPHECCPGNGLQLGLEALLWWARDPKPTALITTGVRTDAVPGALGQAGTRELAGPDLDTENHIGGRFTLLYRVDSYQVLSVDANYFVLEQLSDIRTASSNGSLSSSVVSRPFFNPNTGREDADPIGVPGVQAGTVTVSFTDRFQGAEANVRLTEPWSPDWGCRFGVLAGVRYLALDEKLVIFESVGDVPPGSPNATQTSQSDDFTTFNRFYGAQVGAEAKFRWQVFDLSVVTKVGYGQTNQVYRVRGQTQLTQADGTVVTAAADRGLLVQPSNNVGRIEDDKYSFVPEVGFNVGCRPHDNIRLFLGYTFLYWTDVVRPADQIDRTVNVQPVNFAGQLGTAARPAPLFVDTDYWVQGLTFGVELHF